MEVFKNIIEYLCRFFEGSSRLIAATFGALIGYLVPTLPFALICVFAVLIDCFTAWRLNRRLRKAFPKGGADGKFRSKYAFSMLQDLAVVYAVMLLAYFVDTYMLTMVDLYLPNWVGGIFCLVTLISILENESSCNGSAWAKLMQTVLVDKSERHLQVDVNNDGKIASSSESGEGEITNQ